MSGVKGENSIKLFGADLKTMETLAGDIEKTMHQVRGVKDLGIFRLLGQPNLLIKVDRQASARGTACRWPMSTPLYRRQLEVKP